MLDERNAINTGRRPLVSIICPAMKTANKPKKAAIHPFRPLIRVVFPRTMFLVHALGRQTPGRRKAIHGHANTCQWNIFKMQSWESSIQNISSLKRIQGGVSASQPSGDMGASDVWKLAGRSVMLIKLFGPTSPRRSDEANCAPWKKSPLIFTSWVAGSKKTKEIYIIQLSTEVPSFNFVSCIYRITPTVWNSKNLTQCDPTGQGGFGRGQEMLEFT